MEVLAWLLAVPVLAIAALVTAAVVLAGIYGLAVAAATVGLVFTYRTAGTGGLVVVGMCVLVPWLVALVVHGRRVRREVRPGAPVPRTAASAPPAPAAPAGARTVEPEVRAVEPEVRAVEPEVRAVEPEVRAVATREVPVPRPPVPPVPAFPKGRCPVCGRAVPLTPARGRIKTHVTKGDRCPGMGMAPVPA